MKVGRMGPRRVAKKRLEDGLQVGSEGREDNDKRWGLRGQPREIGRVEDAEYWFWRKNYPW